MNAAVITGLPDAHGLRALRFRLQGRRAVLLAELRAHVRAARSGAPAEPGGGEVLLAQLRELDLAEAQRDAGELESSGVALARMVSGEYGMCVDCANPIGHARLAANPHALRCLECEAAHEHTAEK